MFSHSKKAVMVAVVAGLAGCIGAGVGGSGTPLTVEELDARLDSGPARLEVRFTADGSAVEEIHLDTEYGHDEYVESVVTAADAGAGTITLALDGVVVQVAPGARLRGDDGDLSREAFFAQVVGSFVRAKRPAYAQPAPAVDPGFLANEVRIEDDADLPKVELATDGDNFSAAGGTGTLRVFGREWTVTEALILAHDGHGPGHD